MSEEPNTDEIERMSEEQVNEYLRRHGYDPEKVALEGEVFVDAVDALIKNATLRTQLAAARAEIAEHRRHVATVMQREDAQRKRAGKAERDRDSWREVSGEIARAARLSRNRDMTVDDRDGWLNHAAEVYLNAEKEYQETQS
jgi:hypothetical protein